MALKESAHTVPAGLGGSRPELKELCQGLHDGVTIDTGPRPGWRCI